MEVVFAQLPLEMYAFVVKILPFLDIVVMGSSVGAERHRIESTNGN